MPLERQDRVRRTCHANKMVLWRSVCLLVLCGTALMLLWLCANFSNFSEVQSLVHSSSATKVSGILSKQPGANIRKQYLDSNATGSTQSPPAVTIEAFLSGTPAGRLVQHLVREIGSEALEVTRLGSCNGKRDTASTITSATCMMARPDGSVPVSGRHWRDFFTYPSGGEILALGTQPACFPLMLAGAAVEDWGVAVEIGPFVGQSSRCIAMGLNATGDGEGGRYHVFDSFSGFVHTVKSGMRSAGIGDQPLIDDKWEWFWRMSVGDVYPSTLSYQGFAGPATVKPETWSGQRVALLSVDSIKDITRHWKQLAGMQPMFLERGAIIAFLDGFQTKRFSTFLYGCLREYIVPVYSSWCYTSPKLEHLIVAVVKDIPAEVALQCSKSAGKGVLITSDEDMSRMTTSVLADVDAMRRFDFRLGKDSANVSKIADGPLHDQASCLADYVKAEFTKVRDGTRRDVSANN